MGFFINAPSLKDLFELKTEPTLGLGKGHGRPPHIHPAFCRSLLLYLKDSKTDQGPAREEKPTQVLDSIDAIKTRP